MSAVLDVSTNHTNPFTSGSMFRRTGLEGDSMSYTDEGIAYSDPITCVVSAESSHHLSSRSPARCPSYSHLGLKETCWWLSSGKWAFLPPLGRTILFTIPVVLSLKHWNLSLETPIQLADCAFLLAQQRRVLTISVRVYQSQIRPLLNPYSIAIPRYPCFKRSLSWHGSDDVWLRRSSTGIAQMCPAPMHLPI